MATKGRSAVVRGKTYERNIAKKLTNNYGVPINRVPLSGAANYKEMDGSRLADRSFIGDLFAPEGHPLGIFNFELKSHSNVKASHLIKGIGEIPSFLEQVTTDAYRIGGYTKTVPCLIVHIDKDDDYVILPYASKLYNHYIDNYFAIKTQLSYADDRTKVIRKYDVTITNLEAFMSISADTYNQAYQKINWDILNQEVESSEEDFNIDKIIDEIKLDKS